MKKPAIIHIPEPCKEDWAGMSPTQKGRHCAKCDRVIRDFSTFSDTQLMAMLKQNQGKICGRFHASQVNRVLVPMQTGPAAMVRKFWLWMGLFFTASPRVFADNQPSNNTYKTHKPVEKGTPLSGLVKNEENGEKLSGVKVMLLATGETVITNQNGEFTLNLPADLISNELVILLQKDGFSPVEFKSEISKLEAVTTITMDKIAQLDVIENADLIPENFNLKYTYSEPELKAKNLARLSINVVDQFNIPMQNAKVTIMQNDSVIMAKGITDSTGNCNLDVKAGGDYILNVEVEFLKDRDIKNVWFNPGQVKKYQVQMGEVNDYFLGVIVPTKKVPKADPNIHQPKDLKPVSKPVNR